MRLPNPILLAGLTAILAGLSGCRTTSSSPDSRPLVASVEESSSRHTIVTARSEDGSEIRVSASAEPYRPDSHGAIVNDAGVPETVLKEFRVTIDGNNVSPPATQFAGFADPHVGRGFEPIRIESYTGGFQVYLSGGDGGASHGRRFVFSKSAWVRTEYRDYITGEYRSLAGRR